jgi:HEAT repeat protein
VAELNDSSPLVREKAAFEIGRMGVEAIEAVGDLKRLAINDPDEEVRRASRIALYNVRGGQPSPEGFFSSTPEP